MLRIIVITIVWLTLYACGGGGGGSSSPSSDSDITLNVPNLPTPPVSRLALTDDYVSFFIGLTPLGTNRNLATSQQYTQALYTIDVNNVISPVTFLDQGGLPLDLTGNISFTEEANIIPLDILVMSPDYIMLTIYHRDLDQNSDNDYYNLLVDLRSGNVVSAPVGLNTQGNSGRSALTQLGRDYFPPNSRWNDTEDLYVISVDYEALDLMEEVPHQELVDHHVGVPCPAEPEEDDDAPVTDTTNTCTGPTGGTIDSGATLDTQNTTSNITANHLKTTRSSGAQHLDTEAPTPTSIYKMSLGANNQYSLEQVNLEDDRPWLGQFVASRSGVMIYRNLDGGDNSYRVILSGCKEVTGRVSTVLLAPHSSLIVSDDAAGNSSIFEITHRGTNKLMFSCNGNVTREAYNAYTSTVNSLKLPYNSESIGSYDYIYPYFVNDSCQSGRIFPRQGREIEILNPMPFIPGLPSGDPRGLRKSQMFNGKLYCIGYDSGLLLSIAQLDPVVDDNRYEFLNFDFGLWLPDFDTIHVLSDNHVIFSGSARNNTEVKTIMLNTNNEEFDLTNELLALKVSQQIEITPPTGTTYSTTLDEE